MQKKKKNVFIEGPISSEFIAQSIAKHSSQTNIGAHAIFLGQVRQDKMGDAAVVGIEYSSYPEMADEIFHQMREETFA